MKNCKKMLCACLAAVLAVTLAGCNVFRVPSSQAPAESDSLAPSTSGALQDEPGSSSPFPAPGLVVYEAKYVEEFDHVIFWGPNGEQVDLMPHSLNDRLYGRSFASDKVWALLDIAFSSELASHTTPVVARTTHDEGQTWHIFTLPIVEAAIPDETHIEFCTPDFGWIVYYDGDKDIVALFITQNGGKTWEHHSNLEFFDFNGIRFASPDIGWISARVQEGDDDFSLLQTTDGGATWVPVHLSLDTLTQDPTFDILTISAPRWVNGLWESEIFIQSGGYKPSGYYPFVPSQDQSTWVFNSTAWPMPQGVSPLYFIYQLRSITLPTQYNAQTDTLDWESFSAHQMVHFAASYFSSFGLVQPHSKPANNNNGMMDGPGVLISTTDMERLMQDLFMAEIDATQLPDYDPETNQIWLSDYCGHGGTFNDYIPYSVTVTESGDIELIWDRIISSEGGSARDSIDYEPHWERCIFRPVTTPQGVQMFTLLSVESIDAPG